MKGLYHAFFSNQLLDRPTHGEFLHVPVPTVQIRLQKDRQLTNPFNMKIRGLWKPIHFAITVDLDTPWRKYWAQAERNSLGASHHFEDYRNG